MYHPIHTPSATYTFRLYPIGTTFKRIAGIYIFLIIPEPINRQQLTTNQYSLLYLGITNDFYARLKAHHKIQQAMALGMTHIGIMRKSSGRARKTIEKDLLRNHNPPLNQTWLYDY